MRTIKSRKLLRCIDFLVDEDENPSSGVFEQTAHRFYLKLVAEYGYSFPDFNHVYIHLEPTLPSGAIKIRKRGPQKWQANVEYGWDQEKRGNPDPAVVTDMIAEVMLTLARRENSDIEPIEAVRQELITNGLETVIWMKAKFKQNAKYLVEPFIKVKGYKRNTVQVFLKITDRATGNSGNRMIIESWIAEALSLTGSFEINDTSVIVKPQRGQWPKIWCKGYKLRGFTVPVEVPIRLILQVESASGLTSDGGQAACP